MTRAAPSLAPTVTDVAPRPLTTAPRPVAAPPPAPVPVAPAPRPAEGGWGVPLAVVVVGMFMSVLNTTSVNVALSAMANDLGASTDDIEWVVTAYNLSLASSCRSAPG